MHRSAEHSGDASAYISYKRWLSISVLAVGAVLGLAISRG